LLYSLFMGIKMKINCWRMSYFEYWGGGGRGGMVSYFPGGNFMTVIFIRVYPFPYLASHFQNRTQNKGKR
jgi:hypothetical protein